MHHCHVYQVLEEIEHHNINIYQFPDCDSDEDEDFKQQDKSLKVLVKIIQFDQNMKLLS